MEHSCSNHMVAPRYHGELIILSMTGEEDRECVCEGGGVCVCERESEQVCRVTEFSFNHNIRSANKHVSKDANLVANVEIKSDESFVKVV